MQVTSVEVVPSRGESAYNRSMELMHSAFREAVIMTVLADASTRFAAIYGMFIRTSRLFVMVNGAHKWVPLAAYDAAQHGAAIGIDFEVHLLLEWMPYGA